MGFGLEEGGFTEVCGFGRFYLRLHFGNEGD